MFLEILLAILLGVLAGCFTGLIPGLHVNLIAVLVFSSIGLFSSFSLLSVILFILALSLTHSFLDSIPSIYLGAPNPAHVLSVLPGHQLLHEGKGRLAVLYTLYGSGVGLLLTLALFPLAIKYLDQLYTFLQPFIGYLLFLIIFFLFIYSGDYFKNFIFFAVSGLLGLAVFALYRQEQVLLPLLSGLFGTSTLLVSLSTVTSLPKQDADVSLETDDDLSLFSRATLSGVLAGFLPGFGSSQAAILALSTLKNPKPHHYLIITGALNTINFVFSIITFTLLSRARNGAIVVVSSLAPFHLSDVWLLSFALLFIGGIALLLGCYLSKSLLSVLVKVPYKTLVYSILFFLIIMVAVLSSFQGMLILLVATGLGLLAQHYGAQRNMLLGCLLLPVLLYFL